MSADTHPQGGELRDALARDLYYTNRPSFDRMEWGDAYEANRTRAYGQADHILSIVAKYAQPEAKPEQEKPLDGSLPVADAARLVLEVGKSYKTETDRIVTMDRVDGFGDFYTTQQPDGYEGVFNPDGTPWTKRGWTDQNLGRIVCEVRSEAKPAEAPEAEPSSSPAPGEGAAKRETVAQTLFDLDREYSAKRGRKEAPPPLSLDALHPKLSALYRERADRILALFPAPSLESMRKALERIGREHDCGCYPCTGQCTSKEALQITVDAMRDIARAALAEAGGAA